MLETPKPPAVVLAGGRARRMGGRDKALVAFAGQPLLAQNEFGFHVAETEIVVQQCSVIVGHDALFILGAGGIQCGENLRISRQQHLARIV